MAGGRQSSFHLVGMIVFADTSQINYLILVGHEALLPSLFGEVIISTSMFDELSHPGAPMEIQQLLSAHQSCWHSSRGSRAIG